MKLTIALPTSCALMALVGALLPIACDVGASCPSHPCDPASDGTPFDLLDFCQTSGQCLLDGVHAPVCPHADASPPPSCALGPITAGETLTVPIGALALGGRRELVVTYAQCELDGSPPDFQDVQVLFDGAPAACTSANPCDPAGKPTVVTCPGVPSSVKLVTVSFSYTGSMTSWHMEMQDPSCSYLCS